jgi:hypothetical protein
MKADLREVECEVVKLSVLYQVHWLVFVVTVSVVMSYSLHYFRM